VTPPSGSPSAEIRAARLARREAALAARPAMSPSGPAPDRLRIATWNVNSVRARVDGLVRFLDRTRPDVACLQETRVSALPDAIASRLEELGYRAVHAGAGSWGGVAIVARHEMTDVRISGEVGDEHLDREPRMIGCVVHAPEPMRVVSVYVPHGREVGHWHFDYKLAFLAALSEQLRTWLAGGTPVVLGGDVNVAATDSDVFHPDAFVGSTHVTTAERDALARLLEVGLVDVDVARWGPRARRFTWWNHGIGYSRNLGMRLDVIATDIATAALLDTTWIDHVERGADRPSDHAPLIADFHRSAPPRASG
jgi:exodeoxyribonuclease-3